MIDVGSTIENTSVQLSDGTTATLLGEGHRGTLIYFMRTTTCMMCNAHVRTLTSHAQDFRGRGVRVLVAVPEDVTAAQAWAERRQVPFPVVPGLHGELGLARRLLGSMMQSGTVIADATGRITYADIVTMPTGGYRHRDVLAALDALPQHAG
ncbi:peroxiredoxin family protein [Nocardioides sp. NPDC057767]|uniref:peroxiredoxin family protein n=1 Tax=unclassified Nocardioides TaxID=2615069 RepID=UPI00366F1102